jgi:hypothetical protein
MVVDMIRSYSFSQREVLLNIIDLHTGPFEADVTFGRGNFYRGWPRLLIKLPRWRFDKFPRRRGVIPADVQHLPLRDGCLRSVVFDPPFMARTGPGAKLKERFGELVGTMQDLWTFYFLALQEIHRVLIPQGRHQQFHPLRNL